MLNLPIIFRCFGEIFRSAPTQQARPVHQRRQELPCNCQQIVNRFSPIINNRTSNLSPFHHHLARIHHHCQRRNRPIIIRHFPGIVRCPTLRLCRRKTIDNLSTFFGNPSTTASSAPRNRPIPGSPTGPKSSDNLPMFQGNLPMAAARPPRRPIVNRQS